MSEKVIFIGGGAGGMTTAVNFKKQNPSSQVIVIEKSPYVAWAGCPTPYFIADELPESSVVGASVEFFKEKRNIEVYNNHEVLNINFDNKELEVSGKELNGTINYDKLILAMGGKPFIPNIKGYKEDLEGLFRLSHASDAFAIKNYLGDFNPKRAIIIGAGFIGLEMAEAFCLKNLEVHLIERMDNIFPSLNQEMLSPLYDKIKEEGISTYLSKSVEEILSEKGKITAVKLNDGTILEADIILLSIGLQPNIDLVKDNASITNDQKFIEVNKYLETNIENVYALGDLVLSDHRILNKKVYAPYGDVADKQGLALAKTLNGNKREFKGVIGSFATSFFDIKIAKTGITLEEAKNSGFNAGITTVTAKAKVSGFYNSKEANVEVVYDKDNMVILGAFIVGYEAVAQFSDQYALAITHKIKIDELFDIDYAYSPTNASVWNPLLATYRRLIK